MDSVSEYEAIRIRNLADNKTMLAKILEDLKDQAPIPVSKPPRRYKPRKRISEPVEIRRNPPRSARSTVSHGSPPQTRSRRGSITSSVCSSLSHNSSPGREQGKLLVRFGTFFNKSRSDVDLDSEYNSDEELKLPKKSMRRYREVKSVEEITDEDLQMVAEHVCEKKYDSEWGSTCHQCRQKTDDQKTICRTEFCQGVRGQFCGPCLRNRYGEDAKTALKNPEWICPPCRGICNCSFCRRKSGKTSTGILIHLAREHGYKDVNSYLQSFKK